eukprot:TRINITY_DN66945_c7_g1_i1.p1 TRINITY_DN66945_c7_g1~~TRINITY_DN66945_c7_g1_i1.p1  ORF type:complete len:101 (-),score=1.43 TRINITY_DN66945_c7_g1_i1:1725-2027(-)
MFGVACVSCPCGDFGGCAGGQRPRWPEQFRIQQKSGSTELSLSTLGVVQPGRFVIQRNNPNKPPQGGEQHMQTTKGLPLPKLRVSVPVQGHHLALLTTKL